MNSTVGLAPPQLPPEPPQRELPLPRLCTPELVKLQSGAILSAGFVASASAPATGVAPSLVTTNSQATASYGGGWRNESCSYGCLRCRSPSPRSGGLAIRVCATRN